jgi:hypothetical protein
MCTYYIHHGLPCMLWGIFSIVEVMEYPVKAIIVI